jgi:pyrroline-5-carboxylate reductase
MTKKIAIIGGGNLGVAIAEGLIQSGFIAPQHILITKRNTNTLTHLEKQGVLVSNDNTQAVKFADIIIFAVKPFQINEVLSHLQPLFNENKHILVSVIAGVSTTDIHTILNKKIALVRAIPNTAIAVRQSMTCISAKDISNEQLQHVKDMFSQLGSVIVIEEKLIDAATVLASCGTAYAMRYIRANTQAGIQIGFDAKTASAIIAQTMLGAAQLLLQKNTHPEQEIDKVATPKGCTIAGLNEMEFQGFSSSLIKGIAASYNKLVGE